jgi:non-specific serine/threonine protein kinase
MRFRMLETLREFGQEQLSAEDRAALQRSHLGYFLALAGAAEAARNSPFQPLQIRWMERLEQDHDNLRAALRFSFGLPIPGFSDAASAAEAGLRLCRVLWQFWAFRGYLEEGQYWCQQALEKSKTASPGIRAGVYIGLAFLAQNRADHATVCQASRESLVLSRAAHDEESMALALVLHGTCVLREDRASARKQFREGLCIARRIEALWIANYALHWGS